MRRRGGRKRALGTRAPAAVPQEPNQRWSLDFVSDTLDDGRRFRSQGEPVPPALSCAVRGTRWCNDAAGLATSNGWVEIDQRRQSLIEAWLHVK